MKLESPATTALTEYCLAPWYLRVRWWLAARFYHWCNSFEESGATAPEQVNPLWRR